MGQPWETATEVSIFTRKGVERIMKFAFETAAKREKKHLIVVTKSNAQRNGMVMWDRVAAEVGKGFPEVKVEKMLVDAMTTRMVLKPGSIDTVVATNLVGIFYSFLLVRFYLRLVLMIVLFSMLIFCLILLLLLRGRLGSHQPVTWILLVRIRRCLNQFTVQHLISLEWELVSTFSCTFPI